jgi:predicted Holliday junction resolvase-like endonuclease
MVEQIVAFILGAGITLIVREVFLLLNQPLSNNELLEKLTVEVEELKQKLTDFINDTDKREELTQKRIDQEIDRVNNMHKTTKVLIESLKNKIEKIEKEGCTSTKDLLKG